MLLRWLSLLYSALLVASCATAPRPETTASQATLVRPLFISRVAVVDTRTGQVSPPHDIILKEGLIAAVAPAGTLRVPAGARVVDGSGRFAMPGLIDVHAHVGEGGIAPQDDRTRERALRQFLRYGVTSIFVPGATGAGDVDFPTLRQRCRSRTIACPDLYGTGSIITAPGSHPVSTIFNMPDDVAPQVTEARGVTVLRPNANIDELIAAKAASGVHAIKIIVEDGPPAWYPRPRLTDDQIRTIVRAAHARGLRVFAHISTVRTTRVAVDAGVDGIMHAPLDAMPEDLVRRMAERRTWYVATLSLYNGILTWARRQRESDPYALKGVEPTAVESLTAPPFLAASHENEPGALAFLSHSSANLRRAAAAGIPIALGTDVNNPFVFPGYSAHEELSLMVQAGLTPGQALRAGTLGSAEFLGASRRIGRIARGFEADILLLARNPLQRIENSRSIVAVISDGEMVAEVVSDK